jgi:hypothetical protein
MNSHTRQNRWFGLFVVCCASFAFLAASTPLQAATIIEAASGSRRDIQAAVDGLGGRGVVVIPPGIFDFEVGNATSDPFGVILPADDITIIGSGPDRTRLHRPVDRSIYFFYAYRKTGIRISGFTLEGSTLAGSAAMDVGVTFSGSVDFRVDHMRFSHLGDTGVKTYAANASDPNPANRYPSRGVVDHSEFRDVYRSMIGNYGYGVAVYGIDAVPNPEVPFGSPEATFVEDSIFAGCRHAVASNNAAHYVFRYNDVSANRSAPDIDAHGQEYGSAYGTDWIEAYHNVVHDPLEYSDWSVHIRGGKGALWANCFRGYTGDIRLTEDTPQATGPVYIWNNQRMDAEGTFSPACINSCANCRYSLAPPPSYSPYPYPHPLVTDLVAAAGADRSVLVDSGGVADVSMDGSGSTTAAGSIVAYRWYDRGQLIATGVRPTLHVARGTHAIVLEVERSDGREEHDVALVEVTDASDTIPPSAPTNLRMTSIVATAHDSEPAWVATPSPYDSCIRTSPVLTGARERQSRNGPH